MSAEREGRREQMERTARDMIRRGAAPEYAKRKAREMAIRADRREDKKARNPSK